MEKQTLIRSIRRYTWFFMFALIVSGITATPIQWELNQLAPLVRHLPMVMQQWYAHIQFAINDTASKHGFIFYAFDWLSFAHIIIAIFMYGLIIDPVRNRWLVKAAMIACVLIFPLAFVMGTYRGIPVWWQLIDCSFGFIGLVPLFIIHKKINQLQ